MTYLLDTNVISAFRTKTGQARLRPWLLRVGPEEFYLSVMTVGEVQRGIEKLRRTDASEATKIEDWLAHIRTSFAARILPVDETAALQWGRFGQKARGDHADALIAATALSRGMVLVTRNTKDFEPRGVQVVNPFGPPA